MQSDNTVYLYNISIIFDAVKSFQQTENEMKAYLLCLLSYGLTRTSLDTSDVKKTVCDTVPKIELEWQVLGRMVIKR